MKYIFNHFEMTVEKKSLSKSYFIQVLHIDKQVANR